MTLNQQDVQLWEETTGHSLISPSGLSRIVFCPASVKATLTAAIPPESEYAAEGTRLHKMAEQALREGQLNALQWINNMAWDDEDKAVLLDAVGYVLEIAALHDQDTLEISVEIDGSLEHWGFPMIKGTLDVRLISKSRRDYLDYKFGKGVPVHAIKNYQLRAYALMDIRSENEADNSYTHIIQPYLDSYSSEKLEWAEMEGFLNEVAVALAEINGPNPSYNPGASTCRWCNAKWACKARREQAQVRTKALIKAASNIQQVPKDKWKFILDASEEIGQAIKQLRLYAHEEIKSGRGFPGYKLVSGKANRRFKDKVAGNDYIAKKLKDKAKKPEEYVTLAQAEKLCPSLKKDDKWKALIEKPAGKPMLVPESDGREALKYGAAEVFGELAEEY